MHVQKSGGNLKNLFIIIILSDAKRLLNLADGVGTKEDHAHAMETALANA